MKSVVCEISNVADVKIQVVDYDGDYKAGVEIYLNDKYVGMVFWCGFNRDITDLELDHDIESKALIEEAGFSVEGFEDKVQRKIYKTLIVELEDLHNDIMSEENDDDIDNYNKVVANEDEASYRNAVSFH